MKTIAAMLESGAIELELRAKKKKAVILELAELLGKNGEVSDWKKIAKAVLDREKSASTGIGHGVAIPHRLCPSIHETVIAFGRSERGVPFDSIDRKPAHLIFFILGPEDASAEHLRLLSRLSRLLTQESFRKQLREASSPEAVIDLFRDSEER